MVPRPKASVAEKVEPFHQEEGQNMTKTANCLQTLVERKVNILHLAKEVTMVSIPKIIGVATCSAVLLLSLSNAAQARMSPGACAHGIEMKGQANLLKCDEDTMHGI